MSFDFLSKIEVFKSRFADALNKIDVLPCYLSKTRCFTLNSCVFEGCLWPLAASEAAESRGESAESPRRVCGETAGRHWPRLGSVMVSFLLLSELFGVQKARFKQLFQDHLDQNS